MRDLRLVSHCSKTLFPAYGSDTCPDTANLKPCLTCKSTGGVTTCPECDGDGSVYFENTFNSYEPDCETCRGDGVSAGGSETCTTCAGEGHISTPIKFGGVFLGSQYLKKLAELPNAKIEKTDNEIPPVRFKFDGGVGLLMTRRGDS